MMRPRQTFKTEEIDTEIVVVGGGGAGLAAAVAAAEKGAKVAILLKHSRGIMK